MSVKFQDIKKCGNNVTYYGNLQSLIQNSRGYNIRIYIVSQVSGYPFEF